MGKGGFQRHFRVLGYSCLGRLSSNHVHHANIVNILSSLLNHSADLHLPRDGQLSQLCSRLIPDACAAPRPLSQLSSFRRCRRSRNLRDHRRAVRAYLSLLACRLGHNIARALLITRQKELDNRIQQPTVTTGASLVGL